MPANHNTHKTPYTWKYSLNGEKIPAFKKSGELSVYSSSRLIRREKFKGAQALKKLMMRHEEELAGLAGEYYMHVVFDWE